MKKIGRNEKCPCGSGKKFKRCHGDMAPKVAEVQACNEQARKVLLERKGVEHADKIVRANTAALVAMIFAGALAGRGLVNRKGLVTVR